MSDGMLDVCTQALDAAKKAGADQARATLTRVRTIDIEYRERRPETIKEAALRNLSVVTGLPGSPVVSARRRPPRAG